MAKADIESSDSETSFHSGSEDEDASIVSKETESLLNMKPEFNKSSKSK